MSTFVMMTLDLEHRTPADKRTDFYDRLEKDGYHKLPYVTTAWQAKFQSDDVAAIYRQTLNEIRAHAKAAGVLKFEAVIQIGDTKWDAFDQTEPALEPRVALRG